MTTFDTTDTTRFADSAKAYELGAKPGADRPTERLGVPLRGANNPGSGQATTPGSFANAQNVGGPLTFSSPDTPNMPQASPYTAWDF
ncbi:MAG: hypothetical protein AAFO89_13515, partial [Planctomycetota bacterium]